MEQKSQALQMFETIKLYNQILITDSSLGAVYSHVLHPMLFRMVQICQYLRILQDEWMKKLPYNRIRCQIDWDKWYAIFLSIKNSRFLRVRANPSEDSDTMDNMPKDNILYAEYDKLPKILPFNELDNPKPEMQADFHNKVLLIFRELEADIANADGYKQSISNYIQEICNRINDIRIIFQRPSPAKIQDFLATARNDYLQHYYKEDENMYLDWKAFTPECEFCDSVKTIKSLFWQRLLDSNFLDRKKKTMQTPSVENESDSDRDKMAYNKFIDIHDKLNEDVVGKYIFFGRKELTDEQIACFFGYYFISKCINKDISSYTWQKTSNETHADHPAQGGSREPISVNAQHQALDYVDRISSLVSPSYANCIHAIWESMLQNKNLINDFKPRSREKKNADGEAPLFSKKFVCNIISLLWNKGVYVGKHTDFIRLLENGNTNHTIKNYICKHITTLQQSVRGESPSTIERYKKCQEIIEAILSNTSAQNPLSTTTG